MQPGARKNAVATAPRTSTATGGSSEWDVARRESRLQLLPAEPARPSRGEVTARRPAGSRPAGPA
ncbi:hypothetical protein QJS66_06365 [Kocuria rhizophila]|nr:hypothetical protein QJS66_06365 [Kocuria rhizophila]